MPFSSVVICVLAGFLLGPVPAEARQEQPGPAKPWFVGTGVVSTNEGHATLRWSLPEDVETTASGLTFELEQSRDAGFRNHFLRHRGPERAFFVSGLIDGRNYFRVRAVPAGSPAGLWSDVLVVEVDYPGRGQVILLLVVGCLVFGGTVAAIIVGWLRTRHRRLAENRASA